MRKLVAVVLLSLFFFLNLSASAFSQRSSQSLASLNNGDLMKELGRAKSSNDRVLLKEALIKRGKQIIPTLRDVIENGNEEQKMESLALLRLFRSKESASNIVPLLKDPDKKVRVRAAFSLGKIGDPQVVPALILALEDAKSTAMKKSVLAGLGYIGDKRAVNIMMPYLKHDDKLVQVTAAGSLGLLDNKKGLQITIEASESKDYVLQKNAIFALGLIGGPKAKKQLVKLLSSPDSLWKSYQLISLYRIEIESLSVLVKIERLRELLDHENEAVATWAIDQLGEIGSSEAIEVLNLKKLEKTKVGFLSERQLLFLGITN